MKISRIQNLNNEDGVASIEAVFVIPVVIYILVVIVGFFQYVGNESVFNYNITRSIHLFDFESIERYDDLASSKNNFLKNLQNKLNSGVIDIDSQSLEFVCFKNIDDLVNMSDGMICNKNNFEKTNLIFVSFSFDYKRFSWLFSIIYPSAFLNMYRELVIVNEVY